MPSIILAKQNARNIIILWILDIKGNSKKINYIKKEKGAGNENM